MNQYKRCIIFTLVYQLQNQRYISLTLKITELENGIDELASAKLINTNFKNKIEYLENKLKCNAKIEEFFKSKIVDLEIDGCGNLQISVLELEKAIYFLRKII